MKRFIVGVVTSASIVIGSAGIAAALTAQPEVDNANATIAFPAAKFAPATCLGEDGINYVTYRGAWSGTETDVTPGSTDYNLSGTLTVSKVLWTINLTTQRGVLRGSAELVSPSPSGATGSVTYTGPLTLITQGLPDAATTANGVSARGWINAKTYTNGAADGGSLLANVEFQIASNFSANGEFGASMGFPDYSVADNNKVC